jgi:hypothetical protein
MDLSWWLRSIPLLILASFVLILINGLHHLQWSNGSVMTSLGRLTTDIVQLVSEHLLLHLEIVVSYYSLSKRNGLVIVFGIDHGFLDGVLDCLLKITLVNVEVC